MIFNQLFDPKSHTYTYILSSGQGREALIVDPVIEKTDEYLKILEKLELKLVKVIDTHIHADHISGLNELNKKTRCTRIMGDNSPSEVVDIRVKDGEKVLQGAEAFLMVWKKIPKYRFLYYFLRLPVIFSLFSAIYEIVAFFLYIKNRKQLKN